jgi:hypothetical protein
LNNVVHHLVDPVFDTLVVPLSFVGASEFQGKEFSHAPHNFFGHGFAVFPVVRISIKPVRFSNFDVKVSFV